MNIILDILKDLHPQNDYLNSKDFLSEGLLDSLDIIVLVERIENSFGIRFDVMDLVPENFRNIEAIENLVNKYEE